MMCCYSTLRPQKYRIPSTGEPPPNFIGKKKKVTGIWEPLKSLINLPAKLKIYYGPSQCHGFEEDFQHP